MVLGLMIVFSLKGSTNIQQNFDPLSPFSVLRRGTCTKTQDLIGHRALVTDRNFHRSRHRDEKTLHVPSQKNRKNRICTLNLWIPYKNVQRKSLPSISIISIKSIFVYQVRRKT